MNLEELQLKANEIRKDIIKMLLEAGSGHSAGSLDMTDVITSLFWGDVMSYDPKNPGWEDRDRLFLSNGHICPALYAAMSHAGYFPHEELMTMRKLNSRLQGHPERERLPGIEITSGPLGSGLAEAAGYSYAARIDGKKFRSYCLTSDGEHDEGNHWEAVNFAGKYKLSNLTSFIDRNGIQIDGFTEDVMPLDPLKEKYDAFNWNTLEVDGHNIEEVIDSINMAKAVHDKPTVIICHTIAGKGVEFMENLPEWHGKPPDSEEAKNALKQLRTLDGKIKSEID